MIWTCYGYPDAAKIAEEVVEPGRTLPRISLGGVALTTALCLLLNAAFLHVLPFPAIASSKLVAGDVAVAILGDRGGAVIAALALLVVLASINGNVFVTPRIVFAIARDGLLPRALAGVNRGGSPWAAVLVVGAASLGLAITLVLVIDGATALALVRLRRRSPGAAFSVPAFPVVAGGFIGVYAALLAAAAADDPQRALVAGGILAAAALVAAVRDKLSR